MRNLSLALVGASLMCLAASCEVSTIDTTTKDLDKYGLVCPVRSIRVDAGEDEFPYQLLFTGDGKFKKKNVYNPDGSFRYREDYTYYENGLLHELITINSSNQTEGRWQSEYDQKGRLLTRIFLAMNMDERSRFTYQWADSLMTACEYRMEYEFVSRSEYSYEGDGVKHEMVYDENDSLCSKISYKYLNDNKPIFILDPESDIDVEIKYDEKGLPVWSKNAHIDSENGIAWEEDLEVNPERFYQYSFDKKGNWTERREYKKDGGEVIATVKRHIRY